MFKGDENGAAVYIEKALNKKLIWFPCRHHIYELVLKSVAEVVWPVSCGPSPAVFNRFKREWSTIDQSQYETGMDDQSVKQILCEKKQDILEFIQYQMKVTLNNEMSFYFYTTNIINRSIKVI